MTTSKSHIQRFTEKIHEDARGCWIWDAYVGTNGYGRFSVDNRGALAHRWSYEYHISEIPEALVLDHLCRNRSCVNPWHLEPITQRVNIERGLTPVPHNRLKTHCPRGHEYTEENIYRMPNGWRACLDCKKASARDYYEANRRLVIERARLWSEANPERAHELGRESTRRYRARKKEAA